MNPDPPLDLFRSFQPVSQSEATLQLDFMESESQVLQRYDDQIAQANSVLRNLEDARRRIQTQLDARRSLFSAARRIPVEIWRDIFMRVCFPVGEGTEELYFGFHTPFSPIRVDISTPCRAIPLGLSQICLQWRKVAFGFPDLWSRMWIDLSHLTVGRMSLLENFLPRSSGRPITLLLRTSMGYSWHRDGLENLIPRVRNFLQAAFEMSWDVEMYLDLLENFDFEGKLAVPQLESLTIISPFEQPDPSTSFPSDQVKTLLTAPSLNRLSTLNKLTWLSTEPTQLLIPPPTLTTIECWDHVQYHHLTAISNACPMLTTMRLRVQHLGSDDESPPPSMLLSFPLLQTLQIETISVSDPFRDFDNLILPSLTDLEISIPHVAELDPDSPSRLLVLPSFLRRSGSSLKRFKLSAPYLHFIRLHNDDGEWERPAELSGMFKEVFSLSPEMRELDLKFNLAIYEDVFGSTFYSICDMLMGEEVAPALERISIDLRTFHITGDERLHYDLVHHFLRVLKRRAAGGGAGGLKYGRLCLDEKDGYEIDDLPYDEDIDVRGEVNLEDITRQLEVLEGWGVKYDIENLSV
ncbi:hypothetical protein AAF712_007718 [Marasmius tenuissimus]|uniref:F-box domain-containing protein n=1 Tax=Marasmius tenuissimus TaxID=585030 RepID=A0ABR2ZVM5_9AGAR